jgi:phospholipid transport system substrate-binding protein
VRVFRHPLVFVALFAALLPFTALAEGDDDAGSSTPATLASTDPAVVAEAVVQRPDAPLATPTVERLHAALLEIMKSADQLGYNGRYEHLAPVVGNTFDLQFMASKSVGRLWKTLPEPDQQRWLELFARHITANYAGQFTGFTGEAFSTLGEEPAIRDTRVVRTYLRRPDEDDVQLNYRLRELDGEWRIIDIYLNGTVSELALRRSEYSSVLKREGFESLMSTIDEKCRELEDSSTKG